WTARRVPGFWRWGAAGLASRGRAARAAAWLAFGAAAALRHNAPLLIVPLTTMIAPYAPRWSAWRRRALGAGLGIAVCLGGIVVDRALVRVEEYPFANMIAVADTAGVITSSPPLADAAGREVFDGVPLPP